MYQLASTISEQVYSANSEQREQLHLSAVFACNFLNYMLSISSEIVKKQSLPFEILSPLIRETIDKALDKNPTKMQTGPALRNDTETLNKHIKLLQDSRDWQKIYSLISQSIFDYHQNKK